MPAVFTPARMVRLGDALSVAGSGGQPGRDAAMSRSRRRARGVYFTPAPLVEFVVAEALRARLERSPPEWRSDGSPRIRVLDPAAGDGRFLQAAVGFLARRAVRHRKASAEPRAAIARRCVVGVEREAAFAEVARQSLGGEATVYCAEALVDPPASLPRVDVVVGNPPYQRSVNLSRSDGALWAALKGRYAATSHGEWDLYAAFLEQALEWTLPGGEVGLVVPSRWLTASFASRLRAKLANAAAVRAVVDFGAEQIFDGATTYASVVFLSRVRSKQVAVARLSGGGWSCGAVEASRLGEAPWQLAVGERLELLELIGAAGPTLGDVARIAKGAGTNADPVYVLRRRRECSNGELEVQSKALDSCVRLEPGLLRPCLRGRDVRAYGRVDDSLQCLVPYRRDGQLIAPGELQERWPKTAAYLQRCRHLLDARERGRFRGDTFYRFGRPQNMAYLGDSAPKVVVPDVARGGRALLDTGAALALDSTYSLRLLQQTEGVSLELLLAVLNSHIVGIWLGENGIPLRGNYLRMKTAYLRSLPLPAPSRVTEEITAAVRSAREVDDLPAQSAALSELVRRAYGVALRDWCGSAPGG